jgi:hypothetical protein
MAAAQVPGTWEVLGTLSHLSDFLTANQFTVRKEGNLANPDLRKAATGTVLERAERPVAEEI